VPAPIATPPPPAATDDRGTAALGPVHIEMRNVRLHMDGGVTLDVKTLRGEMRSTRPGEPPVFDDSKSYELDVSDGNIALDMESLGALMNRNAAGKEGSPLSNVKIGTEASRLTLKARLRKGISIPISMTADVSATPDGRMRLSIGSMRALGIPANKLMGLLGLSVADLVSIKNQRGIEIRDNDIIIGPGDTLPPPRIRGRLSRVWIDHDLLRQTFGSPVLVRPLSGQPATPQAVNYIYFKGATLRFGRLTMKNADLMLIDADARDVFDFSPSQYRRQLMAGYSKNGEGGVLRTLMPDFNDLASGVDLRPAAQPSASHAAQSR